MDIYNELYNNFASQKVVSLFLERNLETFVSGFIKMISEEEILFLNLNIIGEIDSIMLIPMSQVARFQVDGLYEKKIDKLFNYHCQTNENMTLDCKMLGDEFLSYMIEKDKYVGIFGFESPLYGKIQSFNNEYIMLQCYNLYGEEDGMTYLQRNEIDLLEIDSMECRVLQLLDHIRN